MEEEEEEEVWDRLKTVVQQQLSFIPVSRARCYSTCLWLVSVSIS
jgi:hypothetical protein